MVGKTLGRYEILEPLGAGGMGEVYLGEDTRLGRKVAIKVLPAEFAGDPERLARFEQEARAAAALNHPHIAVVHDVGSESGDDGATTHFMVQEYLEGQSLRERLDKGEVPLDKALDLATEVGEALTAAHKAGIVHRDLKPDNIFVTAQGHAKVLDFGLAKLMEMSPVSGSASMSPTMLGTVAGQVMGTAGYMAPEQVHGEEIDHRADLFAFGCVLYEMICGERAFTGENVHDTLGMIISRDPQSASAVRTGLPLRIDWILEKAMAKDPQRRYQSAQEVTNDLRRVQDQLTAGTAEVGGAESAPQSESVGAATGVPTKLAMPAAVLFLILGALGAWWVFRPQPGLAPVVQRFEFDLLADTFLGNLNQQVLAISPDGRYIAYVAGGEPDELFLRPMNSGEIMPLRDTTEPREPTFSPDSRQLAFWAQGDQQIKRMSVDGTAPVIVGALEDRPFGLNWEHDGYIYIGRGGQGVWRMRALGGEPEQVFTVDEGEAAYGPRLSPDGGWVLYTLGTRDRPWDDARIVAQSLKGDERRVLAQQGRDPRISPSGHLTYVRSGNLFAVPFDIESFQPTDGAVTVAEGIRTSVGDVSGAAFYAFSQNGSLIYASGDVVGDLSLYWVDDDGTSERLPYERRRFDTWRLSPQGDRIVARIFDDNGYAIWIYDVARPGGQRLTDSSWNLSNPVWSADGNSVYFAEARGGAPDIYERSADFSGDARLVLQSDAVEHPMDVTADGKWLLIRRNLEPPGVQFVRLPLDVADAEPELLVKVPNPDTTARFSPDGRFIVYSARTAGRPEVYVREIDTGSTTLISTLGGLQPIWPRRGSEILYSHGVERFALPVRTDPGFAREEPRQLGTTLTFAGTADATANGRRWLLGATDLDNDSLPRLYVVLNWFEELKRLVPTGR